MPPRYERMKVSDAYFYFDAKKRLRGIEVGNGSASRWMNYKR